MVLKSNGGKLPINQVADVEGFDMVFEEREGHPLHVSPMRSGTTLTPNDHADQLSKRGKEGATQNNQLV